ncbi:Uncharacterized protein APZ42_002170 [Daphnia magna]|uniref:Uncharacterized protein n=1 Tax=Daphnia magna TaxID=35525 RepID=A0A164IGI4_9CRUS|nr:Uncharacterized protein APZ42_002170 [Daphnia magna]
MSVCVSSLRETLEGPFGCTHRTEYTTAATGFAQGQPRENAMDIVAIDSAHKLYTQSYVNRFALCEASRTFLCHISCKCCV